MPANKFNILTASITLLTGFLISSTAVADDIDLQGAYLSPSAKDVILGNKNSPITLIEFGDYQCPFCAEVYSKIEPRLKQKYVNTGKVKMIYRNQQFVGPESVAAAAAAECAKDQGKFWAYHDALYNAKIGDFNHGGGENNGFYNHALFLKLAQQTSLNMPAFTSCLDSDKYSSLIQTESSEAGSMGVNKTPTIYINGVEVEDPSTLAAFQAIINKQAAKK